MRAHAPIFAAGHNKDVPICRGRAERSESYCKCVVSVVGFFKSEPTCADASAQALRRSLLKGIQDGHVEVREITFVPSGHGEAMNASRGGHHGVLT